ncbi:MAG: ribbon-helix-helix domain-containing protein [Spirochaetia bacterium]|nr:ribbon-helix-helix domain-containing protein [Spirochaetia bacterium]
MLTVRLSRDLESALATRARALGCSRSDIVKDALRHYFDLEKSNLSSFELGKDLFGVESNSDGTLSQTYKKKLKAVFNEKRSR